MGLSPFGDSSCFVFMPATIIDSLLKLEVEFCSGLALKQREKLVDFFPNFSATLFLLFHTCRRQETNIIFKEDLFDQV